MKLKDKEKELIKLNLDAMELEINDKVMEVLDLSYDEEGFIYNNDSKLLIDFNYVKKVENGKSYNTKEYKLFRPLYIKTINEFCLQMFIDTHEDISFIIKEINGSYECKIIDVDDNLYVTAYSENEKFCIIKAILMFYYGNNLKM